MPRLVAALVAALPAALPAALLALAPALAPALAAAAAPAAACHCFRSRSFDPADPPAADPYILASARSALLSAAFGVPKATLVRAVMSGTPPEDLWIAHWSAARTGREADRLLAAAAEPGAWRAALAGAKGLPGGFGALLGRGAHRSELAAFAVDDVLASRLGADVAVLRALRAAGASSEQVVVSIFLAAQLKVPAPDLLARFRGGEATWGTLLDEAGLAPERIEAEVRRALAEGATSR